MGGGGEAMTELKACPCCGGEALYVGLFHLGRHSCGKACLDAASVAVECTECGLITQGYMSEEQARESWNRRAGE